MAAALKLISATKTIAEPLICVDLKAILNVPADGLVTWVKSRFTDHSNALPNAIAAANDRAWQRTEPHFPGVDNGLVPRGYASFCCE